MTACRYSWSIDEDPLVGAQREVLLRLQLTNKDDACLVPELIPLFHHLCFHQGAKRAEDGMRVPASRQLPRAGHWIAARFAQSNQYSATHEFNRTWSVLQ